MLTGLAEHLTPDLLAQALDTATAITGDSARAAALTALAPHLPTEQQADVLAQALDTATAITYDSGRAAALTALAPHLPTEQQADVLAQALAAATAITDDDARAEALTGLAEHLPPDLLAQALAATPKESIQAVTALLDRGRSILSSERNGTLLGLLRTSLRGIDRIACLSIITLMAPTIAEIGGTGAVQECIKAIADVHRWWP